MTWTLTLSLESDLASVRKAACICREALSDVGTPVARMEFELAFVEACTNSVKHGRRNGGGRALAVTIDCCHGEVRATVEDEGCPFKPTARPIAFNPKDLASLPTSGLGLQLIRDLVDSIAYKHEDGKNRLILIKNLVREADLLEPERERESPIDLPDVLEPRSV